MISRYNTIVYFIYSLCYLQILINSLNWSQSGKVHSIGMTFHNKTTEHFYGRDLINCNWNVTFVL